MFYHAHHKPGNGHKTAPQNRAPNGVLSAGGAYFTPTYGLMDNPLKDKGSSAFTTPQSRAGAGTNVATVFIPSYQRTATLDKARKGKASASITTSKEPGIKPGSKPKIGVSLCNWGYLCAIGGISVQEKLKPLDA